MADSVQITKSNVDGSWNVMAHAQKPDFVFRRKGRVHLNWRGCQFSRLRAAEVCASAVVMLDTPYSEVVWRVLATHSIRQFPLHFPAPCVTVCHHISTGVYLFLSFSESDLSWFYFAKFQCTWIFSTDFPKNIPISINFFFLNPFWGSRVPRGRTDT